MGEAGVRAMIADLYVELHACPIADMFSPDIDNAVNRSAAFFVGLVGGPPIYHQQFGHPRMRARHMPFAIDQKARAEWLRCFDRVLQGAPEKYKFPEEHIEGFRKFLYGFSAWMVNTAS